MEIDPKYEYITEHDFRRQHFVIETERSGKQVKITKMKDLDVLLQEPSCNIFEASSKYFPWSQKDTVILCFDALMPDTCYSFDGEIKLIGISSYEHKDGGLAKLNNTFVTVGGYSNSMGKTEIMTRHKDGYFITEEALQATTFTRYGIFEHSLITIPDSDTNDEYILLIGGRILAFDEILTQEKVFSFNGMIWSEFGKLSRRRQEHTSIFWNGAVYIIGGTHGDPYDTKTRMEIWTIRDSPDRFSTSQNWPELKYWTRPHLFIVPDSFFPDY